MGYLDKEGLSYFWRKVRTALSGKQEQLTPDESLVLDGGNISVKIPTRHLTKAEYNALTEEEKQADAVYLVDEPQWVPVPLSIQEYDTENGWHVRQWSDGYAELYRLFESAPVLSKTPTGLYHAPIIDQQTLPLPLVKKYSETASILQTGNSTFKFIGKAGVSQETPTRTGRFDIISFADSSGEALAVSVCVKGRWR